jgi:two-component system, NarL family, sensor histidine kinase DegS
VATEGQTKIETLRSTTTTDLDKLRRESAELDALIRQTQSEVEKLAQREFSVANRLRDLEVNLEKYNKGDIKSFFTTAHEVQMRLQMMKGQLEHQQLRQQTLKTRMGALNDLLNALEGLGGGPVASSAVQEEDSSSMIAGVIQAQERERLRISLQMHDGPAQSMSNLILRAEICQKMLDRDLDMARGELAGLKTAVNSTLQDIRRFIFELRPMILDDLGLVPTLRRYAQQFTEKNKVDVNLMVQGLDTRLPSHYEVAIFRFVQEALSNVAKHAGANSARVVLDGGGANLHVSVEDDGGGFPVGEVLADTSGRRNMGIALLRQQAETLLRGEFGIESAVGRGTRVAAVVPLPAS